tara:strand:+ start:3766 stop:4533 length:768 start_codon:yes stop_codon:yes gene_type:complete
VNPYLERARDLGASLATEEFEKQAFLGAAMSALRPLGFLAGMSGRFGTPGSMLYRATNPHIGSALGFGAMSAAGEEEGNRLHGFLQGAAGGLLFSGGMAAGGRLGKRLLAPMSRTGSKRTTEFYKGLGLNDAQITELGSIARQRKELARLSRSGNPVVKQEGAFNPDLRFNSKRELDKYVSSAQKDLQDQYKDLLAGMGKGQRAALRGVRSAKMVGSIVGGTALGMGAGHALPEHIIPDMRTSSGSMFNPYGAGR